VCGGIGCTGIITEEKMERGRKFETRDMEGALFRNEKKATDKDPDYQGNCRVEGQDLFISAWINEAQSTGKKYMKLKFSEPRANGFSSPVREDLDDDIPF
jgi:uncharacterized protein (DUF736 family)